MRAWIQGLTLPLLAGLTPGVRAGTVYASDGAGYVASVSLTEHVLLEASQAGSAVVLLVAGVAVFGLVSALVKRA